MGPVSPAEGPALTPEPQGRCPAGPWPLQAQSMREREGLAFQAPEFPEWEVPPPLTEEPREVQTAPSPGPGGRRAVPPPRTPEAPGPGAHSQLLQARVELHVHGVERVQAAPVLYVSMGGKAGSGQRRGHGKALAREPEEPGCKSHMGPTQAGPHLPGSFQSQDASGG